MKKSYAYLSLGASASATAASIGRGSKKSKPAPKLCQLLLLMTFIPMLVFLMYSKANLRGAAAQGKLKPSPCLDNKYCTSESTTNRNNRFKRGLSSSDAVISIDLLNNWHWCPSALARMRELDGPVNDFLKVARKRRALVIHAVSDSKPHYLTEPGIIQAAVTEPQSLVPPRAREWNALSRNMLREFNPPARISFSLDRACGEAGRQLFGKRKPANMNGLNETNIDALYDTVAIDKDVIYSAIINHRVPIKRILFVGVHLDLCVLYSRWFSVLRIAKFWELKNVKEYGLVANLLDMSTYGASEYADEMQRNLTAVKELACWISCQAAPRFLQDTATAPINVYDFV